MVMALAIEARGQPSRVAFVREAATASLVHVDGDAAAALGPASDSGDSDRGAKITAAPPEDRDVSRTWHQNTSLPASAAPERIQNLFHTWDPILSLGVRLQKLWIHVLGDRRVRQRTGT